MKICLSEAMAELLTPEIRRVAPGAQLVQLRPDGTFGGDPTGTDIVLFSVDLAHQPASLEEAWRLLHSPSLSWVQGPAAGVDLPVWAELVERGVRVTSAAGVHAEPIAQYVMTYVLHWHRQVEQHRRQQVEHRWEALVADDLTTKTLGIVGYGGIGRATARVAAAFGMRVLALRRGRIDDPAVDEAFGPHELSALMAGSDYVVLTLPLNDSTRGMVDARALAAMRPTAVLINVARGGVVDQAALVDALERGAIRGATLDVVDDEPLPADSPLWDLANCVITPHDAGYSPLAGERLGRLFVDNLSRFERGEPMVNEVDASQLPRRSDTVE